jgi:U3 small nucleolar RNA-associated protein 22
MSVRPYCNLTRHLRERDSAWTYGLIAADRFRIRSLAALSSRPGSNPDHASGMRASVHSLASLLRRGLGRRATVIAVDLPRASGWSTTESSDSQDGPVQIGLLLNKEHAFNILDQGPPSEDAAGSEAFRQLWGSKSELRRFKDGRITESVVWNAQRPEERALIPGQVVRWLLSTHFDAEEDEVIWHSPDYLPMTQIPNSAHRLIHAEGSEKLGFRPVMEAFDSLYKVIKAADDDLPLAVLNFSPMSPALRYSSTFIPYPVDLARAASAPECVRYMPVVDVLIQFESSRKWPDDLVAIQKIKLAVLAKTAEVLESKLQNAEVSVVVDPYAPDVQDSASLEVIMGSGHAFHLHIQHDRERTLLERMIEDADTPSEKLRRIAQDAFDLHYRRYSAAPRHHGAVVTLHHMYPSFASAGRLLKRWVASHLLSAHFPEEMLELVMASVYLDPGAHEVPTTAHAGFVRAIEVLAHWDWKAAPLYVPLYTATRDHDQDTSVGLVSIYYGRCDRAGSHRTGMAATWIASSLDRFTTCHTGSGNAGGAAISIAERTGEALLRSRRFFYILTAVSPLQNLFVTDLTEYDFVLHLDPRHNPRTAESIAARTDAQVPKLWEGHIRNQAVAGLAANTIKAGFDPASMLLADLQVSKSRLLYLERQGEMLTVSISCLSANVRRTSHLLPRQAWRTGHRRALEPGRTATSQLQAFPWIQRKAGGKRCQKDFDHDRDQQGKHLERDR